MRNPVLESSILSPAIPIQVINMNEYITKVIEQLRKEKKLEFQIEYIEKSIANIQKINLNAADCRFVYEHVRHLYGFDIPSTEMVKIFNEWMNKA
ncbi:MAG: hypothetical protein V3U54_13100 [Thermodesulfobacteriota bacterium]